MKVYIGYDSREVAAYDAASKTLLEHSPRSIVTKLDSERLAASGLLRRPVDRRGSMYDLVSGATCSTEFANSRFLVPILAQSGWALFVDCDMLFFDDVDALMKLADPTKAVMVVKHKQVSESGTKMDGQPQTMYARKNWSSVMLFNCDHPGNRRLSLDDVNNRPGRDLHAFYWLADDEIGDLPAEWNWLVDVQPQPREVKIAHFTLGGPWIKGWQPHAYDQLWLDRAGG
jgi:lipopolysaccharide biosynthesis glycosyltransferase